MSDAHTFFLLDGHAIAYRAFFGMQGRRFQTRQGLPTGAIFGFTRILIDVIRSYRPHLLAVCFDTKDPTHRHEAFDNYKGHRKPAPDDLVLQMPYLQQMVEAFGIPMYRLPGYEADDLIGTLACRASAEGYNVRVITGDRDLFQLIDGRIRILLPGKDGGSFVDYGAEEVLAKCGYTPEQVVDYKALAGDASDNIPGVRGIGDKSAVQLLQDFGSLEQIYARLDEVPSKWQKKLDEGRADAQLSQQLARILTDAPIDFDPEASKLSSPKMGDLLELLQTLEFNSIQKELPVILGHFDQASVEVAHLDHLTQAQQLRPDTQVVSTLAELEALLPRLKNAPLAFDTETTGLQCLATSLVGISLAWREGEAVQAAYLPVGHSLITELDRILPLEEALALLKPLFEDPDLPKMGHNAKFDVNVLSQYGVQVRGVTHDSMLLGYLLQPDNRHGLKEMALSYLQLEMLPITDLIGSGRKQITMTRSRSTTPPSMPVPMPWPP